MPRRSLRARRTLDVGSYLMRRKDASARLAEADRGVAFARTTSTLGHLVAVLEKGARLAARELERILAGKRELHQRAEGVVGGARQGSRAEQIARLQVAAVGCLVRDDLRERPVRVAEIAAREAHRPLHLWRAQVHLQLDGEAAFALVALIEKVRQRLRIIACAHESGTAVRLQRIHRHDPGRTGGGEALAEERHGRLIFPGLYIAGLPVV